MPRTDEEYLYKKEGSTYNLGDLFSSNEEDEEDKKKKEEITLPITTTQSSSNASNVPSVELTDSGAKLPSYGYTPGEYPDIDKILSTKVRPKAPDAQAYSNSLQTALDKLVAAKESDTASVKKKETISNLIDALGMIAAGMYGQAKGLDMSGTKITPTSFEREYADVKDKYKDAAELARAQTALKLEADKDRYKSEKEDEDRLIKTIIDKYKTTEEGKRHAADRRFMGALQAYASDRKVDAAAARAGQAIDKLNQKTKTIQNKELQGLAKSINSIALSNADDEAKAAAITNLIRTSPSASKLPAESVSKALTESGWFGGSSPKDPEEMLQGVTELLTTLSNSAPAAAPVDEALVQQYMKKYPGRTREEIIKALGR